ncbi:hypothetical protein [Profundibacter sp.]
MVSGPLTTGYAGGGSVNPDEWCGIWGRSGGSVDAPFVSWGSGCVSTGFMGWFVMSIGGGTGACCTTGIPACEARGLSTVVVSDRNVSGAV